MSPEQNDFQDLRRLLALKRHEQPPPGYFNGFSRQVIIRIRADQRLEKDSFAARLLRDNPWMQRVWAGLQAKPSVAGAFGVVVCGLLVSVVLYSEHAESGSMAILQPTQQPVFQEPQVVATQFVPSGAPGLELSSMTGLPSVPKGDSLFEEIRNTPQWRLQQQNAQPALQPVADRIPLGP